MAAEVESMFYTREKPWHGLGTRVDEAQISKDALRLSDLDWKTDRKVLGVVTDRYKVVQNTEAFSFTDALLGEGVRYETAGSLQGGRKVWLLAKLPHE